ncbi:hypothetical protein PoB_000691600 [Plakobranchus ocellatus]|uniref:Uncharacterized protein n=1 Tax=Plakobranchus ocellatus TaxID=259542 RepID=A0AAV3YDD5_9GAST|nr:hypothetical protein PoB_000691600 [Plakobranchus ocellatus]
MVREQQSDLRFSDPSQAEKLKMGSSNSNPRHKGHCRSSGELFNHCATSASFQRDKNRSSCHSKADVTISYILGWILFVICYLLPKLVVSAPSMGPTCVLISPSCLKGGQQPIEFSDRRGRRRLKKYPDFCPCSGISGIVDNESAKRSARKLVWGRAHQRRPRLTEA